MSHADLSRLDMSSPPLKQQAYALLHAQCAAVLAGERDEVANMAQFAALLFHALPDLNWAGFYLAKEPDTLVLGPFQGKVACVRIAFGKGVCGTCAATRTAQIVQDVHAFPGHIACDSASNSELVLPMLHGTRLLGVLDLDSPLLSRFDNQDAQALTAMLQMLVQGTDWSAGK